MYELLLERGAERDLKRLPPEIFKRIIGELRALKETPRPAGVKKLEGKKNDWRQRVGAYRIIYEINDTAKQVRVWRVRHRREVYR
jgi:mRNA interferase RelE/StbE